MVPILFRLANYIRLDLHRVAIQQLHIYRVSRSHFAPNLKTLMHHNCASWFGRVPNLSDHLDETNEIALPYTAVLVVIPAEMEAYIRSDIWDFVNEDLVENHLEIFFSPCLTLGFQ